MRHYFKYHLKRHLLSLAAMLALCHASAADADYRIGKLQIGNAHARATVPGQPSAAVYLSIVNKGSVGDTLLSIDTPLAKSAAVHSMQMDGNVMRMREVPALQLKPSAHIAMQAGSDGYHIMLIGLKQPLNPGDKVPLTLRFEKAGKISIEATVDQR